MKQGNTQIPHKTLSRFQKKKCLNSSFFQINRRYKRIHGKITMDIQKLYFIIINFRLPP